MAKADLRYIIGCYSTATELTPKQEQEDMLKGAGYSVWTFPKCTNAVVTEFPYRSMLSIIIAPSCVYPALKKYFKVWLMGGVWLIGVISGRGLVNRRGSRFDAWVWSE